MEWEFQWGEKLDFLKTLAEQGEEPPALKDRPRLKPWLAEYMGAFKLLSSSRSVGMGGVGAIPISEMMAYFALSEIFDPDERETYITMMQSLDSAYLKRMNTKSDEQRPEGPAKRPRRRR